MLILRKPLSYKDANKILDGFRELGKAARTIYILEYGSSKELRRMVQLACNKSERWHNFQKFVYFWHPLPSKSKPFCILANFPLVKLPEDFY